MEILDNILNFFMIAYYNVHDVMMYPGKYINTYVGHTIVTIVFASLLIVGFFVCKLLLRILYAHFVLNALFIGIVIYYQHKIPHVEIINKSYRDQWPRTWIFRYALSNFISTRMIESDLNGWTFDFRNVGLVLRTSTFGFQFKKTDDLKAYIANGWKIVETKDESVD